ncbi:helix-turn-helix domain-containing protein [Gilliamella sp. Nev3-1]|uniref:helix-turn-helix domain-containing protein n=1 Tax=Gilliamella sp. Nev3-1 TaxID=3120250 RepID=UPI00080DD862|nr:helix-turn-helix transcriptional regulator [Gilliamella apicola]OCG60220.1 transcriptional regulator [Gilliamella apicola]
MNFNSHSVNRLKEERKRLKLTQVDMALICGISREMWGKYERGIAIPGGEIFAALAIAGVNVQFILTGERQSGLILSREEKELIELYRNAPLAIKAAALGALTAGTAQQTSAKQIFNGNIDGQVSAENIYNIGVKRKR